MTSNPSGTPTGSTVAAPPTVSTPSGAPVIATRQRSQFELVSRRFFRHRLAVISLVIFLLINAFAFLGNVFWPYDYRYIDAPGSIPWFSNSSHPLGTDASGHDLLGQVIRGAQQSLKISLLVALLATGIGTIWGAISGFYRGFADSVMMRFVDVILTLPAIAVAITLAANIKGAKWWGIALVLGFLGWAGVSRVIRGIVLSLREQEFVEAARAIGASNGRVMVRHLLPHTAGPVIVRATFAVGGAIFAETGLSYLGLGISPPDTSLGSLVAAGQSAATTRPWLFYFPGLFIALVVLSVNLVGDGLRDALDPRRERSELPSVTPGSR